MTDSIQNTSLLQAYAKPTLYSIITGSIVFVTAGIIHQILGPRSDQDLIDKRLQGILHSNTIDYPNKTLYDVDALNSERYHMEIQLRSQVDMQLYGVLIKNCIASMICGSSGAYMYSTDQFSELSNWIKKHTNVTVSQGVIATAFGGIVGSCFMSGATSNKLPLSHFCDFFTSSLWGFALGAATTYSTIKALDECDISAIQIYHGTYHHDETIL